MTTPRTRDGRAIRMRWLSPAGKPCLLVEAQRGKVEGYYENPDGTAGALLDHVVFEQGMLLLLERLRKARFVIQAAVTEREAFRTAHRDVELEPEVQEAGLRFLQARANFEGEAGSGQPFAERFTR